VTEAGGPEVSAVSERGTSTWSPVPQSFSSGRTQNVLPLELLN
jgi:hypothetical protein